MLDPPLIRAEKFITLLFEQIQMTSIKVKPVLEKVENYAEPQSTQILLGISLDTA